MNTQQRWKLEEDLDGCYVYPCGYAEDDYVFRRVKPVAKIEDSDDALRFVEYLSKLPAFRGGGRSRKLSRALRLQREHEYQSNLAAVRDGSYIRGIR